MTPLHYVELSLKDAPARIKRGAQMCLERALVIAMLDPDSQYMAIEIARIAYVYEIQKDGIEGCHVHVLNARRGYATLGSLAGKGTNPLLSGAQWLALLSGRQDLVALMQSLKQAMAREPGVVFTYLDEAIVPYPDQNISTSPFLAPQLTDKRSGRIIFQTVAQRAEAEQIARAEVKTEVAEAPGATSAAVGLTQVFCEADQGESLEATAGQGPSLAHRFKPHGLGFLARLLGAKAQVKWAVLTLLVLALVLVPSAYSIFWYHLDELHMADIQEMGAPDKESPYFMAFGKRYEIGDRIRFEGQVGVIELINRQRLAVGEHLYEARPLIFFGCELEQTGNLVVYPGSPRKIAGNFWVKEGSALDQLPIGYLSWLGGYKHKFFALAELCDVLDFWALVNQKQALCESEKRIALPKDIQFVEMLEQCGMKGAHISQTESQLEVSW